jgi:hypothetical protein
MEASAPPQGSEQLINQFSLPELIQILLSEDKSKKYLAAYSVDNPVQTHKQDKMREKIILVIKQNGFEYFVDRLIEKQVFLSAVVRSELENYLTSQNAISETMRRKIWLLLTNTPANMRAFSGTYQRLSVAFDEHIETFNKVIVLDLKRTGGSQLADNEREMLRRVLCNYAKRNQEIGYCQGFNFVVYFLYQMRFAEEEIFWIICYLFDHVMPPNYYIQMIPVIADLYIFKKLFRYSQPKSYEKIKDRNIDINFAFIPCFVTVFTNLNSMKVP